MDVSHEENGYLLLATSDGKVSLPADCCEDTGASTPQAALRENNAVQHSAGAGWITLLDPSELKARLLRASNRDQRAQAYLWLTLRHALQISMAVDGWSRRWVFW